MTTFIWTRITDKYGRSVHELRNEKMRTLGVVVRIPKRTAHLFDGPYFSNDWATSRGEGESEIVHHQTLKAAKAHLEAKFS